LAGNRYPPPFCCPRLLFSLLLGFRVDCGNVLVPHELVEALDAGGFYLFEVIELYLELAREFVEDLDRLGGGSDVCQLDCSANRGYLVVETNWVIERVLIGVQFGLVDVLFNSR
jgi:hypothetical protein